ncbi:MAG: tRNA preQ1(34) S-adenosylmethionine ribosyltransferase-isomerase QueA [Planctomycetota bacterium]|jgi:S-adenosylmethionine:tRNA ribosyltransferase-isomerase
MRTDQLNYDLDPELIAQQPSAVRSDSRLLVLNRNNATLTDSRFRDIGDFLAPGDCLVLNDTKVLPARFYAHRKSGAGLEGLFLNINQQGHWEVMLKGLRKIKVGEQIYLTKRDKSDFCSAQVIEKLDNGKCTIGLQCTDDVFWVLEKIGFAPLPPYIRRNKEQKDFAKDSSCYQTVYANKPGAIAAPTAGLHFTKELIENLKKSGIKFARITLHVGAGTFKPVKVDILEDHQMEPERFSINQVAAEKINSAKGKAGRIIAVGTTAVRTIESIAASGRIEPGQGETNLFITPGYQFKVIDAMITNFHLPKSTLLALVASFAGLENILAAYKHAVEKRYRFYSYGDAMLIL